MLTCRLGERACHPLSCRQYHRLLRHVPDMESYDMICALAMASWNDLPYTLQDLQVMTNLLLRKKQLKEYCRAGARQKCMPLTRLNQHFPGQFRAALGEEAPVSLWYKGDLSLLNRPVVSLVGNRDLFPPNAAFAAAVGREAAKAGFAIVSGNARGADTMAQEACLNAGGKVISIVADRLADCPSRKNVLYLSEDGYDLHFSAARALSRNRLIHILGEVVFVAQCTNDRGGTWRGTTQNLANRWRQVCCFNDGSPGTEKLIAMGAVPVTAADLPRFLKID